MILFKEGGNLKGVCGAYKPGKVLRRGEGGVEFVLGGYLVPIVKVVG